jgi:ubiquinone/menaquinone biosynthesis C-methylase UbiE
VDPALAQSEQFITKQDGSNPFPGSPGLSASNFKRIAKNGFGDPMNSYIHSMAWFQGHLYASTTRTGMNSPRPFNFETLVSMFPVKVPKTSHWDNDYRAQIWRYNPSSTVWSKILTSPMYMGNMGFEVPRYLGFRCMTIFQGEGDSHPALYTPSWSTRAGPGPIILRCLNGTQFEEASEPGMGGLVSDTTAIRSLVSFKGRLFACSTGRSGSHDTSPEQSIVFESSDPSSNNWCLACEPSFGDRGNLTICEMQAFNGFLYAATLNPYQGFQIWKTDAEGRPPYRWHKVISHGAYRGKENEAIAAMGKFKGNLYLGTAINYAGYDRMFGVGPAAPEIICLHPDDSWDLVVGESRFTPNGFKVPLSGLGSGFNNGFTGYLWQLCEHDGWLYATTLDKIVFLPYATPTIFPPFAERMGSSDFIEKFIYYMGGFDLWRTHNGIFWDPVTNNGFGNPFNFGGRTLVSTPHGLFVGTANSFGPEVAVKRRAGWFYEKNPDGGGEVWLGSHEFNGEEGAVTVSHASRPYFTTNKKKNKDPVELVKMYYGYSGFNHVGYWNLWIRNAQEACENLLGELLAFSQEPAQSRIPKQTTDEEVRQFFANRTLKKVEVPSAGDVSSQTILDVDCGVGATTRYLLKYFSPEGVIGATADKEQLTSCLCDPPGAKFLYMKLPSLNFPDKSFDYVLSVESISRFERKKLLQEIFRVLKPGGQFICSDILYNDFSWSSHQMLRWLRRFPPLNPEGYRNLLHFLGFSDIQIFDATSECWQTFFRHSSEYFSQKILAGESKEEDIQKLRSYLPGGNASVSHYLLISAKKPK